MWKNNAPDPKLKSIKPIVACIEQGVNLYTGACANSLLNYCCFFCTAADVSFSKAA